MSKAKPATKTLAAKKAPSKARSPKASPLSPWQVWSADPEAALQDLVQSISTGTSLRRFAEDRALPFTNVRRWIDAEQGPNGRAAQYARAREDRADHYADEIVAIGDEATVEDVLDANGEVVGVRFDAVAVARNKLRIDARKWVASKMKPKVYGERTTVAGDPDAPIGVQHALTLTNDQLMAIAATALPTVKADG